MGQSSGQKKVISEDLGFLTDSVIELVKKTGYPGMKVLQFAFNAWQDNEYLPHNYAQNCVVYTGTHDNDTTAGFIKTMSKEDQEFAKEYLDHKTIKHLHWAMIRAAISSTADKTIIPIQYYLRLLSDARINNQTTIDINWIGAGRADSKNGKDVWKTIDGCL